MERKLTKHDLNDSVTMHMRRDFVQLPMCLTVREALQSIRIQQPEGRIIYFYVTDDDGRLCGVVPTRRLLLSPPEMPLSEIMVREVIAISDSATVLDACEFFVMHRLLAFPVVDEKRHIVGLVDVELYTEEMQDIDRREGNDNLFQLIGVHLSQAQQADPVLAFRERFPWLLCNVAGGILAAFLSGFFEVELKKAVALALFIPVVLALAESVSIQSVSLALQTMHGPRPTLGVLAGKLGRELLTGTFLGIACGTLVALVALVWVREWPVAACVLGGIGGSVAAAALLGVATPNLLRMFRLDPQVAAGPIALASTDMVTLLLYFNFARLLLP